MALEIHTVELRAKDSMSPVFKNAGNAATQTARTISQSFQQASESTRRFSVASAAMGASIASATLVLGEWSRAAAEDAAGQDRLQQAVENTGKSYDQYADQIDQVIKKGQEKAYADDATREALVRLTTVTGDAGKAMEQMGLVMDFARARGISLADSANVIGKVMGGNVGILSRYGFALDENATATEALALIQQRSAGQADTYADSQLGQLDRMKDKWGELAETIGGSTGELQQFLMLLPGLSAGYTALSGIISGMGGLSALAKFGGPLALAVGGASLAYGYSQDTMGTTGTNDFWNNFFLKGSQTMNAILPGNPYNEQKYIDQMALNEIGSALEAIFLGPNEGSGVIWDRVAQATGNITGEMSEKELKLYVQSEAVKAGLTVGQYLVGVAEASSLVRDPVTGVYMEATQAARYAAIRQVQADPYAGVGQDRPTITSGDSYMSPAYKSAAGVQGGMTRLGQSSVRDAPANQFIASGVSDVQGSMTAMGAQSVQIAENATRALQAQYGAWIAVVGGITSTSEALSIFNAAQNELSTEMSVYQGQANEWTGQLNAQEAAYEILQKRQQEGIALTGDQTKFMTEYAHAVEVGTGAVEDATIAAGINAQNLLLNKDAADVFKSSVDPLTDSINVLIETLGGIPPTIETEIRLSTDSALSSLYGFLSLIPTSVTVPMYVSGQQVLDFMGGGNQHGGIVGARHGRVLGGNYTLVGEDGPELLTGGRGAGGMVIPASATRAKMRGGSGGGDMIFNAPITVIANDPRSFANQMREYSVGGSRA